jgi:phospholipase/carboxylesterase
MPATTTTRAPGHPTEGFRPVAPADRPARVYLPTDYQPKYAYPLVVLFHDAGACEDRAARLVPLLSRRNYIVLCLRGPVNLGCQKDGRPAFAWGAAPDRATRKAIRQVARQYSVHSERIFLLGVGEGASAAVRVGSELGDAVAGVVALPGAVPAVPSGGFRRSVAKLTRRGAAVRVLRDRTGPGASAEVLADVNRWIMAQITDETAGV